MRLALLCTALLALAPAAQAQDWNQLLIAPGADVTLPSSPAPVLAPDGTGMLFVQTYTRNGPASPFIKVHALGGDGLLQPSLDILVTPFAGHTVFIPQGVSARNGHRTVAFASGTPTLVQSNFGLYRPGETVRRGLYGFQHGAVMSRLVADSNGGNYVSRMLPDMLPDRPTLHYFGNGSHYISRYYAGCAAGEHLRVALLDADYPLDANGKPVSAVTRCLDPSSPGTVALTQYHPQNGSILSVRRSWPYSDSAAPVVAAYSLGDDRFVVEQADAASGEHIARVISNAGEGAPLPLPPQFRLLQGVRQSDFTLLPAVEPSRGQMGALYITTDGKHADWIDFGDLPPVADLNPAWAADSGGNLAVAYRSVEGAVQVFHLDTRGSVITRRSIEGYGTRPGGRVVLAHEPNGNGIVLAADVVLPDGRDAVYVEQFHLDDGTGTIPWPPIQP